MKKLLLALLALPVLAFSQGTPMITMISDGDCPSGTPKLLEIYANGTVDFSLYRLENQTNASTTWGAAFPLTALGTVTNGFVYVNEAASSLSTVEAEYGTGLNIVSNSVINLNGDDRIRIVRIADNVVIDQYGQSNVDGTGEIWEYLDGYATRINGTLPTGQWEPSHWSFFNGGLDGEGTCQNGTPFGEIVGVGSYTSTTSPATECGITADGLTALTCNDNGTGNDSDDDYLTFSLNPTGTNLGSNGYTVSVSAGTITPSLGLYGEATSFQLQNGSASAADVIVTITDADSTSCSYQVTITSTGSCSSASPVINTSITTLNVFNHMVGTPSTSQNFTVNGIALTDDITVTAPAGFEVSLDNTAFASSVSLTQASGTVATTTISVRGNASVYGPYAGNIIISSTGADNDTVAVTGFANDYVAYTIDQINGIDPTGVADSLNVLVELSGVVQCMDYRAAGYSMVIIDGSNKGINVYRGGNLTNYIEPVGGDSITVKGKIVQFRGLLQVEATEITFHGSNYEQVTPIATTVLDETTENYPVVLQNITLVPNQTDLADGLWPASGSYNPTFTDGTNEFKVRAIGTPLAGTALPNGPVSITGIASQFASSTSAPFLDGYQLLICNENAIAIVCEGANLPNATINVFNDTTLVTTNIQGATYIWTNCDTEEVVTGATAYNFTPTVAGNYKVTIINGECEATSTCSASKVSIENAELGKAIAMFPNPVVDQLTINNFSDVAVTFTVTDMNGKVVTENTTLNSVQTINTTSWNKGVYFVNFIGANNATHTMKVVK